jgi:hypothetical protein
MTAARGRARRGYRGQRHQPLLEHEARRVADRGGGAGDASQIGAGSPYVSNVTTPRLQQRAADLLEWVWTHTVAPNWPRRRRIIEADIVARTTKLGQGGWAAALTGMRPGLRWLGEGRLQINGYGNPPWQISGSELFFVPVTPHAGWVAWDEPRRYAVMYPCSGTPAHPDSAAAPQTLAALLGPARAAILVLLGTPKTTTQLVVLTGQGLGSAGRHLKILWMPDCCTGGARDDPCSITGPRRAIFS